MLQFYESPVIHYMKTYSCFIFLFLIVCACNSRRLENTKELSREIKASQIKRVTNTQLIYSADEWGKMITRIAAKALETELEKHPEKAAELCKNLHLIPVIAALQKEYGVQVQLLGVADATNNTLAPKEKELFDAYLYSAKNKTTASDNIQPLSDTLLVYNAPVMADSQICKVCIPDQELPFALWRLLFDKKEIIRKLDAKQLKN
jgi:hypothetical protein